MSTIGSTALDPDILKEWSEDLQQLAFLHGSELTSEVITVLRDVNFPSNLAFPLQREESKQALLLLAQGLQALPDPITTDALDVLAVDYADIYLNHTLGASPYESVWIDEDHLALQEPTFQVRAFYKRFHLKAKDWRLRSEDHITSELEFMAHLLSEGPLHMEALEQFMDRHLLRWLPEFSARVALRASTDFFMGLGLVTACYAEELRALLEEIHGTTRPSKAEIDALMKPARLVQISKSQYVPGAEPSW